MTNTYEDLMVSLLTPLNIFSFANGSMLESKLKAMGGGMDGFAKAYADMYERRFIDRELTEDECDNYLRKLGYYDLFSAFSVEFKRKFCINYYKNARKTSTLEGMKKFVEGMGITAEYALDLVPFYIIIFLSGGNIANDGEKYAQVIRDLLPLEVQVEFSYA